jgi:hypothetical protein
MWEGYRRHTGPEFDTGGMRDARLERHRLVGPRPHGALTVCGPLGVLWCVSNSSYTSRPIHKPLRYSPHHDESTVSHHSPFRMGMHPPRVANLCTRGQDWWEGSWCGRPPHTIVACRHDRRTLRVPRCRQVSRDPPGDYRIDVTRYLVGKLDARSESFGPPPSMALQTSGHC